MPCEPVPEVEIIFPSAELLELEKMEIPMAFVVIVFSLKRLLLEFVTMAPWAMLFD